MWKIKKERCEYISKQEKQRRIELDYIRMCRKAWRQRECY